MTEFVIILPGLLFLSAAAFEGGRVMLTYGKVLSYSNAVGKILASCFASDSSSKASMSHLYNNLIAGHNDPSTSDVGRIATRKKDFLLVAAILDNRTSSNKWDVRYAIRDGKLSAPIGFAADISACGLRPGDNKLLSAGTCPIQKKDYSDGGNKWGDFLDIAMAQVSVRYRPIFPLTSFIAGDIVLTSRSAYPVISPFTLAEGCARGGLV